MKKKLSQCQKKLKGRTFLDFSASIHPFCCKTPKKIEEGTVWRKTNRTKFAQCQKKSKGGPFGLVRYGMLRGKPFCFSSLGQQVQKIRTKFAQCQKKSKGGTLWSSPVWYVTRQTFLFQFLGPTGTFWLLLKI